MVNKICTTTTDTQSQLERLRAMSSRRRKCDNSQATENIKATSRANRPSNNRVVSRWLMQAAEVERDYKGRLNHKYGRLFSHLYDRGDCTMKDVYASECYELPASPEALTNATSYQSSQFFITPEPVEFHSGTLPGGKDDCEWEIDDLFASAGSTSSQMFDHAAIESAMVLIEDISNVIDFCAWRASRFTLLPQVTADVACEKETNQSGPCLN